MSRHNHTSSSVKHSQSQLLQHECRICGGPAAYFYYGVLSCQSCKIFFRRNASYEQKELKCRIDGQCEINIHTRHLCSPCRLAKCFLCGMTSDKFRSPRCKTSQATALVKVQSQHPPEQLPVLNLLQANQSLLTNEQWTILSNIFHCYQESNLHPVIKRLTDTRSQSPLTIITYPALVDDFLAVIYETTGAYFRSNGDLCEIPSDDRSILIRSAVDNICCSSGAFIMQNYHLYSLDAFMNAMIVKYGQHTMDIHVRARKFIDPDTVLIKLALALFVVSENTCSYSFKSSTTLTNPIRIFEIQNKYAEITWKYLLYRYGHQQAVKRFLNIISWLMAITYLVYHAQSLTPHLNDVHSLVEEVELKLVFDDADRMNEMS